MDYIVIYLIYCLYTITEHIFTPKIPVPIYPNTPYRHKIILDIILPILCISIKNIVTSS